MFSIVAGNLENLQVTHGVADLEVRQTGLLTAKDIPGTPQLQVPLGDFEAIIGLNHRLHPGLSLISLRVRQQEAVALPVATTNPAPQLVELGQAEAVGVVDDHHGGIRVIDPDLDDRR